MYWAQHLPKISPHPGNYKTKQHWDNNGIFPASKMKLGIFQEYMHSAHETESIVSKCLGLGESRKAHHCRGPRGNKPGKAFHCLPPTFPQPKWIALQLTHTPVLAWNKGLPPGYMAQIKRNPKQPESNIQCLLTSPPKRRGRDRKWASEVASEPDWLMSSRRIPSSFTLKGADRMQPLLYPLVSIDHWCFLHLFLNWTS